MQVADWVNHGMDALFFLLLAGNNGAWYQPTEFLVSVCKWEKQLE